MQYATVDVGGRLTGFFDDTLHGTIPAGAVELTPDQYQEWLTGQAALVWQNGALSPAPAPIVPPALVIAQKAAAAVAAGCPVESTATPALSGTYAIDPASTANINAVSTYISVNGKFPAGQSAVPWPDAAGNLHSFTTPAQFQSFASAIADWVMKINLYAMGQAPALPTGSETIA